MSDDKFDFSKIPLTNGLKATRGNRGNRGFVIEATVILLVIGVVLYLL